MSVRQLVGVLLKIERLPLTALEARAFLINSPLLEFFIRRTGPIPEELGKLTAVKRLYLSGNKLSGKISKFVGSKEHESPRGVHSVDAKKN